MSATDTYRIVATVRGEYEDEPTWTRSTTEYLSPDQDRDAAMATTMRSFALEISPEVDDSRSVEAIYAALNRARADLLHSTVGPATRNLLLGQLWQLAEALNLEWWGVRPD